MNAYLRSKYELSGRYAAGLLGVPATRELLGQPEALFRRREHKPYPGITRKMGKLGRRTIRTHCRELASVERHFATDYPTRPPPVTLVEALAHAESTPRLAEGDAKPQRQQARANTPEGSLGEKDDGPVPVKGTAIMPKCPASVEPGIGRAAHHRQDREFTHVPLGAVASLAAEGVADKEWKSSETPWGDARRQTARLDFLGTPRGTGGKDSGTPWVKGPVGGCWKYSSMGTNRWGDDIPGAYRPGSKRKARSSGWTWLHSAYPGERT